MINSELFLLLLTIGSYLLGCKIFEKYNIGLFNPLIISLVLICSTLCFFDIDYQSYRNANQFIHFMLGPSVVALGYKLHEQYDEIKRYIFDIVISIVLGSITAIISVILTGYFLNTDQQIVMSLQPKSVTTPIALSISEQMNGIPSITVVVVIIAGIMGAILGPAFLKICGFTSPISIGLALGASSHGLGTARAFQIGNMHGTTSGIAMGLMGVITAILIPTINLILIYFNLIQ